MQNGSQEDQKIFEASIQALQSEIANVGVHLIIDAEARQAYSKQILRMSKNKCKYRKNYLGCSSLSSPRYQKHYNGCD